MNSVRNTSLIVLLVSLCLMYSGCSKKSSKENPGLSDKTISVDEVVKSPDKFKGFLGIEGTVIKVDESNSLFLLGCEDACIFMPVQYKGQIPRAGTRIVVYGEIKKQENGKYIFEGKEVKTK